METKTILIKSIQVIVFLFASFSYFLVEIAPPSLKNTAFSFETGISSFFSLCVLLYISAATKDYNKAKFNKLWRLTSLSFFIAAIIISVMYRQYYDQYTVLYPNNEHGRIYSVGKEFTELATNYMAHFPQKNIHDLISEFDGTSNMTLIWAEDSIKQVRTTLSMLYVAMIITLSTTIFSLTEGILAKYERKNSSNKPTPL